MCDSTAQQPTSEAVFWLSIGLLGLKNLVVGYVLAREPRTDVDLVLFLLAIGREFVIADHELHDDHRSAYDR